MKRYALLSGATYYPAPGFCGLDGFYDDLEPACDQGKINAKDSYGWYQVVDMTTGKIVAGEGSGHTGMFGKCPANPKP